MNVAVGDTAKVVIEDFLGRYGYNHGFCSSASVKKRFTALVTPTVVKNHLTSRLRVDAVRLAAEHNRKT